MDRNTRRRLRRENVKRQAILTRVPHEQWPLSQYDPKRREVWVSRDYLVQVFAEPGMVRISVNRTTARPDGRWDDGLTWDEMQAIKADIGYGDSYAIEVYPRNCDVVNVANMRHLWVLPEPLNIGWFSDNTQQPGG